MTTGNINGTSPLPNYPAPVPGSPDPGAPELNGDGPVAGGPRTQVDGGTRRASLDANSIGGDSSTSSLSLG